jgi:site-specific DNA recombinase
VKEAINENDESRKRFEVPAREVFTKFKACLTMNGVNEFRREVNSLDAQREACEAYIKSQAHEGWRLVPDRFDDGAFSGASLDRPALQDLLEQVRSQKIDIVVVYKVDRLTRSLADGASDPQCAFVLCPIRAGGNRRARSRQDCRLQTQRSLGRGTGSPWIPKRRQEAQDRTGRCGALRKIFGDYLRLGSIGELSVSLEKEAIKLRSRHLSNGKTIAAGRFMVGPLAYLLKKIPPCRNLGGLATDRSASR